MSIGEILSALELIKKTYKDLIITNNFHVLADTAITWPNYKKGIFKNFYSKEYEFIIKNRQYSFLLKDSLGCVQFFYEFTKEGKVIKKIRMAYYPYPVILKENANDVESYLDDAYDETLLEYYYDVWEVFNHQFELNIDDQELRSVLEKSLTLGNNESIENLLLAKFDYKYQHTNTSHFRIDYDADVTSHNKCEIQIGAINNIRLPLDKIISPVVFFDFILKNITRKGRHSEMLTDIISTTNYARLFNSHRSIKGDIAGFNENNIFVS